MLLYYCKCATCIIYPYVIYKCRRMCAENIARSTLISELHLPALLVIFQRYGNSSALEAVCVCVCVYVKSGGLSRERPPRSTNSRGTHSCGRRASHRAIEQHAGAPTFSCSRSTNLHDGALISTRGAQSHEARAVDCALIRGSHATLDRRVATVRVEASIEATTAVRYRCL